MICQIFFVQVMEGADVQEMMVEMMTTPICADRPPLWKARLIPVSDDAPNCLPEIKAAFPYQYDFVFLPHHAIADGTAMITILQTLVDLLNDVIAGKSIEDEPIGVFMDNKEIIEMDTAIMRELEKDPKRLSALKQDVLACDITPIILKAFPPPGGKPATRVVHRDVNTETLVRFRAACKANGVSFNSGFEAVINTALVEMMRDAGMPEKSYNISIKLATDLRRYMQRRSFPMLSLLARTSVHRMETPVDARDHFWEYARKLHQTISQHLKSKEVIEQDVVR